MGVFSKSRVFTELGVTGFFWKFSHTHMLVFSAMKSNGTFLYSDLRMALSLARESLEDCDLSHHGRACLPSAASVLHSVIPHGTVNVATQTEDFP